MSGLYVKNIRNLRCLKDSKFAIYGQLLHMLHACVRKYDCDVNDTAHIKCVRGLTLKC